MKNIICIISALLLMAFSCKKESQSVTVVKNCTGTYLRVDEKNYHVCNPEKVSSYTDGTVVSASFKKTKECDGSAKDAIVCMMAFQNEGWIEVEEIK